MAFNNCLVQAFNTVQYMCVCVFKFVCVCACMQQICIILYCSCMTDALCITAFNSSATDLFYDVIVQADEPKCNFCFVHQWTIKLF